MTGSQADRRPFDYGIEVRILGGQVRQFAGQRFHTGKATSARTSARLASHVGVFGRWQTPVQMTGRLGDHGEFSGSNLGFVVGNKARDVEQSVDSASGGLSTSAYIHSLRCKAGLSIAEVAERAGVDPDWLERFEGGLDEVGINYDQLLALVRATQPPRPQWWDEGHEHDLHLPPEAIVEEARNPKYWERIERVRSANRNTPG